MNDVHSFRMKKPTALSIASRVVAVKSIDASLTFKSSGNVARNNSASAKMDVRLDSPSRTCWRTPVAFLTA